MYKRLATLVCPSAPFLVPRRVLNCSRARSLQLIPQHVRFFTVPKKIRRQRRDSLRAQHAKPEDERVAQLNALRNALDVHNWEAVKAAYPLQTATLSPYDTFRIVQLLHFTLRRQRNTQGALPGLYEAADELAEGIRTRNLPAHPAASLHLLSIYKEAKHYTKGQKVWAWLSERGDEYVDASVYGSAIELLAYGGQKLSDLEALYNEALKRFPGTFAEYHLSPEAVVPDRGQTLGFEIDGLPMTLLQGIFTARVLLGDWRNAYLAFDTVLRLFPNMVPTRFFELLIYERPLAEAIQVFRLACYSKIEVQATCLTALFSRIVKQQAGYLDARKLEENVSLTSLMFDLFEARLSGSDTITRHYVNMLMKGLSNTLVWSSPFDRKDSAREQYNLAIATCAKRFLEMSIPRLSGAVNPYSGIIALAGKAKDMDLLTYAAERVSEQESVDAVTWRSFVTAAGLYGDLEGLKSAWQTLINRCAREGRTLELADWQALAEAARNIQLPEALSFVNTQLVSLRQPSDVTERIQHAARRSLRTAVAPDLLLGKFDFTTLSDRLKDIVGGVVVRLDGDPMDNDSPLKPAVVSPSLGSKEDFKVIYDELTLDPLQPPRPSIEPATDSAGFTFDTHRFENWNAVNELLAMAERYEAVKEKAVDEAIATGRPVKDVNRDGLVLSSLGKSTRSLESITQEQPPSLSDLRQHILNLRARG